MAQRMRRVWTLRARRERCGRAGRSEVSGFWSEVEEERGDSGVGQMSGDAGAHGSGAENGGVANEQRFGADERSGSCGRGGSAHAGSPLAACVSQRFRRHSPSVNARSIRKAGAWGQGRRGQNEWSRSAQYSILFGEAIHAAKLAHASSPSNCVERSLRWLQSLRSSS